MLTENSRTTEVTAIAENENYQFNVNYSLNASKLLNVRCIVNKKSIDEASGEQPIYVGTMYLESGNKNLSIRDTENIPECLAVFEKIIEEIKLTIKK